MFFFALFFVGVLGQQRDWCLAGTTCTSSTQCSQPNGVGGTILKSCCASKCVDKPTPVTKGNACSLTDPCMMCDVGLLCTAGLCVQPPITQFTPGCKCANNSQCLSGRCISQGKDATCVGTGLFAGSSCQYGIQCISGWCDMGKCRGIPPTSVSNANGCANNNDCDQGKRCSPWGQSGTSLTSQCHDLNKNGFQCYSTQDCIDYYGHENPRAQCLGAGGGNVGECKALAQEGEICAGTGTIFAPDCGYYSVSSGGSSYELSLTCNSTLSPPRCEKPQGTSGTIAVGQPCQTDAFGSNPCVSGAYCDTNQPYTGPGTTMGTCRNYYNVQVGGNCSDYTYSCQNPNANLCKLNPTSGVFVCQAGVNSLGKACSYTNTTMDALQCQSDFGYLICACDNTCKAPTSTGGSSGCSTETYVNYNSLLYNFAASLYGAAKFTGKRQYVADYLCCTGCQPFATPLLATQTGIVIDCEAKTFNEVQICDDSFVNVLALKNCEKYVPAQASIAHVSFVTIAILFIATSFAIV